MSCPKFSVIVTCYNLENYIGEAIYSVINQDYDGEMEIIVVNDASTDHSIDVINAIIQENKGKVIIKLIDLKCNLGVSGATSEGIKSASGEWILFADGDDIQMPDRVSTCSKYIEQFPQIRMITMSYEGVNAEKQHTHFGGYVMGTSWEDCPERLLLDSPTDRMSSMTYEDTSKKLVVYGGCMCIHRSIADTWGGIVDQTEDVPRFYQDPILEVRSTLSAPVLGVRKIAIMYRSHASNLFNSTRVYGDGVKGCADTELWDCGRAQMMMNTYERMIHEMLRALKEPHLTDCPPSSILRCIEITRSLSLAQEMKYKWWGMTWGKRLLFVFTKRHSLPAHFRNWPLFRLMPLTVVALLKYWRQRYRAAKRIKSAK